MNKNGLTVFFTFVLLSVCLLTAFMVISKPTINKTVILQIQNIVKK